jgi:hypothetical protein
MGHNHQPFGSTGKKLNWQNVFHVTSTPGNDNYTSFVTLSFIKLGEGAKLS